MLGNVHRYRIGRLLGRGGMAEVFEAQAAAAGGVSRRVAVKRLLPGHEADPATARMFLDEARIASHLHHGALVALFDYGVLDGQPFQVLELVDGKDAGSLRRIGAGAGAPMPPEIALHVVAEVALALHYAHHVTGDDGRPIEVVHRDVKPSNVLVSWNGDVKLGDFGIASALVRSERTLDGGVKGTPAYMGPEQLRGEPLDARADIFALGCTLSSLLAGSSPLSLRDNTARMLRGEELELPESLGHEEAAIIARAVRVRPEERYPTAGEMADELGDLLARRIRKAPRSLLLEWLARVRPHAPAPAPAPPGPAPPEGPAGRARFDDLLGFGLDLEMELDPAAPETRRFVTRTVKARRDAAAPVEDLPIAVEAPHGEESAARDESAPGTVALRRDQSTRRDEATRREEPEGRVQPAHSRGPVPPAPQEPPPPIRPSRRRWGTVVIASAIAALAAGWVAFRPREGLSGGSAQIASSPPADTLAALPPPAPAPSSGDDGAPVPGPSNGAAEPDRGNPPLPGGGSPRNTLSAGDRPTPSNSSSPGNSASSGDSASSSNSPSPGAPPAPSSGAAPTSAPAAAVSAEDTAAPTTGFVVIRGPGSVGAEIQVDGASRGYAPKRIELPLGAHSVGLVLKDGTRLGPRGMKVTVQHTRSSPLAWDVAAP